MVIRRRKAEKVTDAEPPRGFDAYDLRLGDLMRGERATLGKSLLDVERDIRIRASYIAAIENADPEAFDTPGFIPGYVRSYARYLGMDPDEAFAKFCAECGFSVAHGMSSGASSIRKPDEKAKRATQGKTDPLVAPRTPFLPEGETVFSGVEPGAIGSALVLVALISAIGFGGWTVLNEIQRVQFAPVENTPDVLTDLDPLDGVALANVQEEDPARLAGAPVVPSDEGLDRMYRPQALDVPVMIARDAPISTLNPAEVGTLRPQLADTAAADRASIESAIASAVADDQPATPQVVADPLPGVRVVAVRPAWIRVRAADGSVLFEGILNRGQTYNVPTTEEPPTLRVGESGAVYFEVAGKHYGPVGPKGSVTSGLALAAEQLTATYEVADVMQDQDLLQYVAELETPAPQE